MATNTLTRQVRAGEDLHTEFKRSASPVDTIARAVCGFLNSNGGTVLIGIDDDGRPVGIDNADAEKEQLERVLQDKLTPKALFTMSVEILDDRPIIVIEVPEGKDRPYVIEGAVYVRQGAITRAADAQTLRNLVQDKAANGERWERRPATALEFDDLDVEEIRSTVSGGLASGRFHFGPSDDPIDAVGDLSMLTATGFTQAADVLFGKLPSRRHPQCRIRMIQFRSDKGGDTYEDDRWFEGPLVPAFESAFKTLSRRVRVQSYFPAGQPTREDRPEYALDALREGLVNAIAHRDYSAFSGGVTISVYPDRIELWNSGRLPEALDPADLRRDHPSIPTNPDIAHVLYLRGLMEKIGRGTQRIIAATKELGAPSPRWVDRPSGVTLTLFAGGRTAGAVLELNLRQLELLRALKAGDQIHPATYAESVADKITERQARRDLLGLEGAGFLARRGSARATFYERTPKPAQ